MVLIRKKVLAVKRSRSSFIRKCDAAYLHFGFIATDDAGVPKPQCVVCGVVLGNDSIKPSHLKSHLHLKHKEISTKLNEFFERKRGELKCVQKKIYGLTHTWLSAAFYLKKNFGRDLRLKLVRNRTLFYFSFL